MVAFYVGMLGEPTQTNVSSYTIGSFDSNTTILSGPSAGNYTNQTLPVVTGVTRTTTTAYTTGQANFLTALYAVVQLVVYFIGLLLAVVYLIRYFGLLNEARRKPKRGLNG